VLQSLRQGGYDPSTGKSLGAYFAGIARNVVGQYFRQKQKNVIETGVALEHYADSENILANVLEAERDRILRQCLRRLPAKYKEVLLLRIYEQLAIEDISRQLGLERRRVSERIHYALQLLAKECRKENYFQY
jgi:RNA polymerase sigma factor (sigma-70 family)